MGSIQRQASSGLDGDPGSALIDERKRKRMLSNRASARRSRMRKQQQLEDLTREVTRLQIANIQLVQRIKEKEQAFVDVESVTSVLRAQCMELGDRLQFLNSIIEIAEDVRGFPVSTSETSDPLMKPWELPYQAQPLIASADMVLN